MLIEDTISMLKQITFYALCCGRVNHLPLHADCVGSVTHRVLSQFFPLPDYIKAESKTVQDTKLSDDNKIQALSDNLKTWSVILLIQS